mgnify:CR=1 FL=1
MVSRYWLLLSYLRLLRINEVLALRREDVVLPGDNRMGVDQLRILIRLKVTKTGKHQWVAVQERFVAQWLSNLVQHFAPAVKLFPFTAPSARSIFRDAVANVGLPSGYVPHSLRHGGATALHLSGVSMEDILLRGRWSSVKAARTYIQMGKGLLIDAKIDPTVLLRASELRRALPQ